VKDSYKQGGIVRKKHILETQIFFNELSTIKELKVYTGVANFVSKILIKYGIYLQTSSDKIGLDGKFIRITSRIK
jgi:hypothetical protein